MRNRTDFEWRLEFGCAIGGWFVLQNRRFREDGFAEEMSVVVRAFSGLRTGDVVAIVQPDAAVAGVEVIELDAQAVGAGRAERHAPDACAARHDFP